MANGFLQPKSNRYLLASQLFRQAPTTHWTGALAQALGGLTAGLGAKRQRQQLAGQQSTLAQALQGVAGGQPIQPQTLQGLAQVSPQLASQLAFGQRKQVLGQQAAQQQAGLQQQQIGQQQEFQKEMLGLKFANDQALLKQRIAGEIRKARMKDQPIVPEIAKGDELLGGVPIEQLHKTKAGIQSQKRFDLKVKNVLQDVTQEIGALDAAATQFERAMKGFKPGAFAGTRGLAAYVTPEDRSAYEDMVAIRDKFALKQRPPSSGVMTDMDMRVYQGIVPGPEKSEEFNKMWIDATRRITRASLDKQRFFDTYERKFRNLQGAETAWQEYLLANPIFASSSNEDVVFNENRTPWKEYFGLEKKKTTAPVQTVQGQIQQAQPVVTGNLAQDAQSFGLKFE